MDVQFSLYHQRIMPSGWLKNRDSHWPYSYGGPEHHLTQEELVGMSPKRPPPLRDDSQPTPGRSSKPVSRLLCIQ
jgi:hypothetical protein